ncbi:hypothetical protein C8R45DRAFT_941091 [Mycena sanguinolenta]|nr:hypothetical protein C8R45DRAFT_941091 [Mycena sanguinolenta]
MQPVCDAKNADRAIPAHGPSFVRIPLCVLNPTFTDVAPTGASSYAGTVIDNPHFIPPALGRQHLGLSTTDAHDRRRRWPRRPQGRSPYLNLIPQCEAEQPEVYDKIQEVQAYEKQTPGGLTTVDTQQARRGDNQQDQVVDRSSIRTTVNQDASCWTMRGRDEDERESDRITAQ